MGHLLPAIQISHAICYLRKQLDEVLAWPLLLSQSTLHGSVRHFLERCGFHEVTGRWVEGHEDNRWATFNMEIDEGAKDYWTLTSDTLTPTSTMRK